MKKVVVCMSLLLLFGIVCVAFLQNVEAHETYYSTNCSSCHGILPTCSGCHAMGTHSNSLKNDMNVRGTTNKGVYAPGEQVSVTIYGGYRTSPTTSSPGWTRLLLLDQNMVELARSAGTTTGSNAPCCGNIWGWNQVPVTLTAHAPTVPGTYTWNIGWYGNKYDLSECTSCGLQTFFGARWTPDANNPDHGYEYALTNAFTVSEPTPSIRIYPSSLNFGTVIIGSPKYLSTSIQNLGNADLQVTDISLCNGTSSEFSWSPSAPFTIASSQSGTGGSQRTLNVTYRPVDASSDNGCLAISSNDPVRPVVNLNLSGSGVPAAVLDLDVAQLSVTPSVSLRKKQSVSVTLSVLNPGTVGGSATATIVGIQNGIQIYNNSMAVSDAIGDSMATVYAFPSYAPTARGTITWTATIADQNPDTDSATAMTSVNR